MITRGSRYYSDVTKKYYDSKNAAVREESRMLRERAALKKKDACRHLNKRSFDSGTDYYGNQMVTTECPDCGWYEHNYKDQD